MSEFSSQRQNPVEELDLILKAYESLQVLADSRSYEGEVIADLVRQLNMRLSDELARLEVNTATTKSYQPLRPV